MYPYLGINSYFDNIVWIEVTFNLPKIGLFSKFCEQLGELTRYMKIRDVMIWCLPGRIGKGRPYLPLILLYKELLEQI